MQAQALPGFRDFYPEDFARRRHILDAWREVAQRYGFEEYDGPPLESLDLYTAKSGEEIVGQLYSFTDKGGREVALRPEMTPTLARMVAARARGLKKPIRWFSMPQLFRYERQQRGRLREHFQLNCDLIGEASPLADAEIVALAIDVMRALGLGSADVRVRISDRRLIRAVIRELGFDPAHEAMAFSAIDKLDRREAGTARAGLLGAGAQGASVDSLAGLKEVRTWSVLEARFPAVRAEAEPLRRAWSALEAMGFGDWLDLDLTIVRGLAYYTGTVFELFDAAQKFRAICGGGRYDDLLEVMGGEAMPALGFGMGDVVLAELLQEKGLFRSGAGGLDGFLAAVTEADLPAALGLARALRDVGLRVEYALSATSLARQLKLAAARGARAAVLLGPDDRAAGAATLREMSSGEQRRVALDRVAEELRGLRDASIHRSTTAV